jgi:hypothetical protein
LVLQPLVSEGGHRRGAGEGSDEMKKSVTWKSVEAFQIAIMNNGGNDCQRI